MSSIRIREISEVCILDIDGKIDINSSEIIETIATLTRDGKRNFILNLADVDLVDYSGLSVLAIAYKSVVNHAGKLKFLNISNSILELFKVAKLDTVFESYNNECSALESFRSSEIEQMHLRRRFKRLDIHIPVKYRIFDGNKDYLEARALNLSASGIFIFTHTTLPLGTRLELEFDIAHLKHPLMIQGRVAWLADKELQPHYYPGMGVIFYKLESSKEKVLIRYIDKNISHRVEPE